MTIYREQEVVPAESIQVFWDWFEKNAVRFREILRDNDNIEQQIFVPLAENLRTLNAEIFFLLGYKEGQAAELILTADGNIKNMFLVDELLARAPQLEDWCFVGHKQAMELDNLKISIGEYHFNKDTIFFRPVVHEAYPDLIDLEVIYADHKEEDINTINQGIFIFLDNYLGELNFVKNIDNIRILPMPEDREDLVPVYKLKDYLVWREKEFVEKYNETTPVPGEENYTVLSATLPDDKMLLAVINTEVLQWDAKASHPWVGIVSLPFDSTLNNGFPDEAAAQLLDDIEKELTDNLPLEKGVIHIGRQTVDGTREIFFAARDFDWLSKVFYHIQQQYLATYEISTEIYKDKYWRTFDKYRVEEEL